CFHQCHSTIDHLVTLRVLMEESRFKGKRLYCCFVDFKKAFDMIPRNNLWRRMEELQVPSEFMLAVSRIYEKVICQLRIGREISGIFVSTIGVKQGCPLSPTLFGLCIDQLEQMVLDFIQEEGIEEFTICNAVIMLLLYADDVVLLAHTLEDAQKLMVVLENF
ncbi:reverse transcriptase domain-containing protein, partial [Enterobacter cloacae complex sp. 2DZ2F2B]|uniref:reverse transcriptase domain-containing protein n=1 Tax=Enterobacter cloacae complex sp. 2DZ2F2B TaxID=2511984 RepID=UPI00102576A4